LALGLRLHDATGGYRAFRRGTLLRLGLDDVASQGYCFQVDLARRTVEAGMKVQEVPITFVEREIGTSKMSRSIVAEALWRVTVWGAQRRWDQITGRSRRDRRTARAASSIATPAPTTTPTVPTPPAVPMPTSEKGPGAGS
jgi:dolichol-phosphate mannosyltransferase